MINFFHALKGGEPKCEKEGQNCDDIMFPLTKTCCSGLTCEGESVHGIPTPFNRKCVKKGSFENISLLIVSSTILTILKLVILLCIVNCQNIIRIKYCRMCKRRTNLFVE